MSVCPIVHLRAAHGAGGGADTVIFNLLAHLDRDRFQPRAVYLRKPHEELQAILSQLRKTATPVTEIPGRGLFDVRQYRVLRTLVRTHNVKLLHCHDPKTSMYACVLRYTVPGLRTVSTIHGWAAPSRKFAVYTYLSRLFLKRLHAVIAVSRDVERTAVEAGLRRITVIHNGIDAPAWPARPGYEQANASPRRRPFTVAYVGRLSPEKGPLDFIRAAERVHAADAEIRFIVAGGGRMRHDMAAEASRRGIAHAVSFRGGLAPAEMRGLYREIDVVLSTSYSEGLPMALLEALASGVNVVETSAGGVPELISEDETGCLADVGDTATLARHILSLKQDPEQAAALRRRGRCRIKREFSVQKMVQETETLYSRLLR